MSGTFTYSVLQYKHSLLLGETINVGILFYFPQEAHLEFVKGDLSRAKAIYPGFSLENVNESLKNIDSKILILEMEGAFVEGISKTDFNSFIGEKLFNEDESTLQFADATNVIDTYHDMKKSVDTFSRLMLPVTHNKKSNRTAKPNRINI